MHAAHWTPELSNVWVSIVSQVPQSETNCPTGADEASDLNFNMRSRTLNVGPLNYPVIISGYFILIHAANNPP